MEEELKEFYISIEDENGNYLCRNVPFTEDKLVAVSEAAGGLSDFIREYREKYGRTNDK